MGSQGRSQEFLLGRVSLGAKGGPRAILTIENTYKYVAINVLLMYNFAEIYENLNYIQIIFIF